MSIKLKMSGFNDLLEEIQKANGNIDGSVAACMRKSAGIMQNELKSEMAQANVDGDLIARMPEYEVETEGNATKATVGYKKGAYNPKNLSDGYKVVFINYGTPRRTKHGKIEARGFIAKAKKKATKPIKTEQEKTLKDILKGLQK